MEAGKQIAYETWSSVSFEQNVSAAPLVLARSQTHNGNDAITIRIRNMTANDFEVRLQQEQAEDVI